jgi:microsomal epoxide hydrolase
VYEFHKVVKRLTDPENHGNNPEDSFDLIIPSIPGNAPGGIIFLLKLFLGYAWSEAPEPGFDVKSAAQIFIKLMQRLGYNRYVAAGGDWGNDFFQLEIIFST